MCVQVVGHMANQIYTDVYLASGKQKNKEALQIFPNMSYDDLLQVKIYYFLLPCLNNHL